MKNFLRKYLMRFLGGPAGVPENVQAVELSFDACRMVVAVRDCMMLGSIHADWTVEEILEKHGVESVQLLAKKAQDTAEQALTLWEGKPCRKQPKNESNK